MGCVEIFVYDSMCGLLFKNYGEINILVFIRQDICDKLCVIVVGGSARDLFYFHCFFVGKII